MNLSTTAYQQNMLNIRYPTMAKIFLDPSLDTDDFLKFFVVTSLYQAISQIKFSWRHNWRDRLTHARYNIFSLVKVIT